MTLFFRGVACDIRSGSRWAKTRLPHSLPCTCGLSPLYLMFRRAVRSFQLSGGPGCVPGYLLLDIFSRLLVLSVCLLDLLSSAAPLPIAQANGCSSVTTLIPEGLFLFRLRSVGYSVLGVLSLISFSPSFPSLPSTSFETKPWCAAQAAIKLTAMLLPLPSQCRDFKHVPCLASSLKSRLH